MGKPRRKGMLKGRLKRFSDQAINGGRYSPHKPSNAERKRKPRFFDPFKKDIFPEVKQEELFVENTFWDKPTPSMYAGHVKSLERNESLPRTKGSTEPLRERTEKWHALIKEDRVLYGAQEHFEIFNGRSFRHVREAGVKVASKFSFGVPIPDRWRLCFEGHKWYWLELKASGDEILRKSIIYSNAQRAERAFLAAAITWIEDS